MAAGLATLAVLRRPNTYDRLEELGSRLGNGLIEAAANAGIPVCLNRVGSAMTMFFCQGPVTNYDQAKTADTERFGRWFRGMRERGIFLAPSQFETMLVSLAHSENEIDELLAKAAETLGSL
jgi:glutamate-1-semialdehyde 2,1-aminomutase